MTSDDALILIQLLRILQSITWNIRENPQSNWVAHFKECEFFGDSIIFMLNSSTNGMLIYCNVFIEELLCTIWIIREIFIADDLLIAAMNLLESIFRINLPNKDSFLKELFKIDDLIHALLESFMQLISMEKLSYTKTEMMFIEHWLGVLIVIIELGSLKFEDLENDENFSKLMEIMYRILKPYKESYNLFPIQELNINVINETVRVLLSFHSCDVNISPKIDHIIVTIIFYLKAGT